MVALQRPGAKKPLDIDVMLRRISEAVKEYPKAALCELAEAWFDSPFEILVACIISIRPRDETTVPTAKRLFERARTPAAVADLMRRSITSMSSGFLAPGRCNATIERLRAF